jgi:hypothetical protein
MDISLQLGQKFILLHSHLHLRQVQVSFILAFLAGEGVYLRWD